ncbi:MAG: HAD-IA family hydrolase, partial [Hyphomicrobiaceae bacterium]
LFAITNFAREKWALSVERFPFLETRFRDVAVSGHEGVIKPDPEIFERLLARNNLQPESCIFIDDSPKNVAGARGLGIDAVLFTDPPALHRDLAARNIPGVVTGSRS